ERPRYESDATAVRALADAFAGAIATGNTAALAQLLHDDAVFYSDGGGKRRAALNPIVGKDKIVRFYDGILRQGRVAVPERVASCTLNGLAGFIVHTTEGTETMAFDIRDGLVVAIYAIRNPDKLAHLS